MALGLRGIVGIVTPYSVHDEEIIAEGWDYRVDFQNPQKAKFAEFLF